MTTSSIDWVTVRLNSTISPTLLNEARYQWGRDKEVQFSTPPFPGEPTNAVGGRSPQTFIQNGFTFGMPEFLERPAFPDERRNQFADTLTLSSGNHTFKFGGDINFVEDIISNLRFSGGEFNYTGANGLNDFIVDYVNFRTPYLPTLRVYRTPPQSPPVSAVSATAATSTRGSECLV